MSISDILDGAFKLYKANLATILIVVGAFVVPLQLIAGFLQRNVLGGHSFFSAINDPSVAASDTSANSSRLVASVVTALIGLVLAPLIAGAISRVVAASYLGDRETAGSALGLTAKRSWALLIAFVLVHLLEWPAFVLCIFPGICIMTIFVSVAPAIMVERLGPLAGMGRSWRLTKSRFWPTMGVALLTGILASVLGSILGTPFSLIALAIGYHWGWILVSLAGIVTALITYPFVAIVSTLIYFDLRIRKEGFDLQMIATALTRQAANA